MVVGGRCLPLKSRLDSSLRGTVDRLRQLARNDHGYEFPSIRCVFAAHGVRVLSHSPIASDFHHEYQAPTTKGTR